MKNTFKEIAKLSLVLLVLGTVGCKSPSLVVGKIASKYPTAFRDECITRYPPQIKDSISTVYKTIRDTVRTTLRIDCDSIEEYKKTPGKVISSVVFADCPPSVTTHDTVEKVRIQVVQDTKKIDQLSELVTKYSLQVAKQETTIETKNVIIVRLSVICLIALLLVLILLYKLLKR
jgi:hypothetical protein